MFNDVYQGHEPYKKSIYIRVNPRQPNPQRTNFRALHSAYKNINYKCQPKVVGAMLFVLGFSVSVNEALRRSLDQRHRTLTELVTLNIDLWRKEQDLESFLTSSRDRSRWDYLTGASASQNTPNQSCESAGLRSGIGRPNKLTPISHSSFSTFQMEYSWLLRLFDWDRFLMMYTQIFKCDFKCESYLNA